MVVIYGGCFFPLLLRPATRVLNIRGRDDDDLWKFHGERPRGEDFLDWLKRWRWSGGHGFKLYES